MNTLNTETSEAQYADLAAGYAAERIRGEFPEAVQALVRITSTNRVTLAVVLAPEGVVLWDENGDVFPGRSDVEENLDEVVRLSDLDLLRENWGGPTEWLDLRILNIEDAIDAASSAVREITE